MWELRGEGERREARRVARAEVDEVNREIVCVEYYVWVHLAQIWAFITSFEISFRWAIGFGLD